MTKESHEQQINLTTEAILGAQNPIIPVVSPELISPIIEKTLFNGEPVNFISIACPNWVVTAEGIRSVQPIADQSKPQQFFGEDLPRLIKNLADLGIKSRTLIIVSDIFSKDWVADTQQAKTNTAQNIRTFQQILFTASHQLVIDKNIAQAQIRSQAELIGRIPEAETNFQHFETEILKPSSPSGSLFLRIWTELDRSAAYAEKRQDKTGLRKIRDRAAFLTTLYLSDGILLPKMLQTAFNLPNPPDNIIGMNLEMEADFANALMWGWTAITPRPVITPTVNGTDWT